MLCCRDSANFKKIYFGRRNTATAFYECEFVKKIRENGMLIDNIRDPGVHPVRSTDNIATMAEKTHA